MISPWSYSGTWSCQTQGWQSLQIVIYPPAFLLFLFLILLLQILLLLLLLLLPTQQLITVQDIVRSKELDVVWKFSSSLRISSVKFPVETSFTSTSAPKVPGSRGPRLRGKHLRGFLPLIFTLALADFTRIERWICLNNIWICQDLKWFSGGFHLCADGLMLIKPNAREFEEESPT